MLSFVFVFSLVLLLSALLLLKSCIRSVMCSQMSEMLKTNCGEKKKTQTDFEMEIESCYP